MTEQIIVAGSGGQGIMLLGKVLVAAGLNRGYQVSWFPTYGAEVRGGTAYCMVIISSEEIPSPYINEPDTLIIMNEPSMLKFKQRIKKSGLLLINSSLVNLAVHRRLTNKYKGQSKGIKADYLYLPFTEAAIKLGNIKVANMVSLGAYIVKKDILNKQAVFDTIEELAAGQEALVGINKQAVEEGMRLLK